MKLFEKTMKGIAVGWSVALCGGLLCGCGSLGEGTAGAGPGARVGGPTNQTPAVASLSPDLLRPGDRLTITFADIPAPPAPMDVRVRDDGTISLPLDVQLGAAGKRTSELEGEIKTAYVPKYYVRLTASVKSEERVIFVRGQVRAPNRYPYTGEMTVLKAVSLAGDFTDFAKKTRVELIHPDKTKIILNCKKAQKEPKYDRPVYPGDTVFVPQKFW